MDGPFRAPRAPGAAQAGRGNGHAAPIREKIERDCLKLIQAVQELKREGNEQSLRVIAARTGLSKDEVNRYLSPTVRELYDYERLLHVRRRNRPLYNWLIVSGPPKVLEGKWAGILANTSKHGLFQAVALKYGYVVRHLGQRGAIIDVEYHGIENVSTERLGKVFSSQEAILALDEFLPSQRPDLPENA
ncbi:MAG TPA: hypothetical protein VGR28_12550 [Candidatus Thermoplasmatota archaeon]|nr:hypothetical protein [Candidatus Thermoplasmatota archaeon]